MESFGFPLTLIILDNKRNVSKIEMARPNEGFLISSDFAEERIWLCMVYLIEKISSSIHFSENKEMSGFAELVLLGTRK